MTLESRLSKLEASILPEVRPPKVAVIEGYRDGEDKDAAQERHLQRIPRTGVLPSWFSFERYSGATTNDYRLSCYECAAPPEAWWADMLDCDPDELG
jgi:hypothetical protein